MTVTEQLSLLVAAQDDVSGQPRCRMCARPARRHHGTGQWGMYCAGHTCSNRQRLCQRCGATFAMGVDGAGTKYCSAECKRLGYHPERADAPKVTCAWCGAPCPYMGRNRQTRWPYICAPCIEPIKHVAGRLRDHNVPHERARQLIADPGCEVCGADMLEHHRQANSKVAALLVVDHDHTCCPADTRSCGKCVRGLLCRSCNVAAGHLRDDPSTARALAAYLDRAVPARLAEES